MAFKPILMAFTVGLAACTTTAGQEASSSGARDCFRTEQVSGYEVIDEHNIRVRVGPARSYTLNTTWNANDLDWTNALALRSDTGWICTGNTRGGVEVTGGTLGRTYPIQTVTRDPPSPGQESS